MPGPADDPKDMPKVQWPLQYHCWRVRAQLCCAWNALLVHSLINAGKDQLQYPNANACACSIRKVVCRLAVEIGKGKASTWAGYIEHMPRHFNTLPYWSKDELEELHNKQLEYSVRLPPPLPPGGPLSSPFPNVHASTGMVAVDIIPSLLHA